MGIEVEPFGAEADTSWDRLVERSVNGTFLHSRKYLNYHGDRFIDESVLVLRKGRIRGVFPAAKDPTDSGVMMSHPGLTYGGLVHDGDLHGVASVEAVRAISAHYQARGYQKLRYKAIPRIYQVVPAEDDLYALFRMDGVRYRCDLGVGIRLADPLPRSTRRMRSLRRATKANLEIKVGSDILPKLWEVLQDNLWRKHRETPTHSLAEISLLSDLFRRSVEIVGVFEEREMVAGAVLFKSQMVAHAQYIATSPRGAEAGALDYLFDHCLKAEAEAGRTYFSFGISTEDEGTILNDGLHRFKAEFGGAGIVHEFYEVAL